MRLTTTFQLMMNNYNKMKLITKDKKCRQHLWQYLILSTTFCSNLVLVYQPLKMTNWASHNRRILCWTIKIDQPLQISIKGHNLKLILIQWIQTKFKIIKISHNNKSVVKFGYFTTRMAKIINIRFRLYREKIVILQIIIR